MRTTFTAAGCAALVALLASSPQLFAQQKTVRECRAEWSANREAIAASGKTQRVFVAECRGVPVPASHTGLCRARRLLRRCWLADVAAQASGGPRCVEASFSHIYRTWAYHLRYNSTSLVRSGCRPRTGSRYRSARFWVVVDLGLT
jgi:hypothetical protein